MKAVFQTSEPKPGARISCGPRISADMASDRPMRQQIFERVRAEGLVPRVHLVRELATSAATVTTLTSDLIDRGLLEEVPIARDPSESSRGRPPVALGVRQDAHYVAGIKLSDQAHTAVLLDFAGNQIANETIEVSGQVSGIDDLLGATSEVLERTLMKADMGWKDLSYVGIGVPGFVDHETGYVHWSPILNTRDAALAAVAEERFGLPVTIDNDANMAALAELWFGAGRDRSSFIVISIEHGVGMGLVIGHRLYRGGRGLGMELAHTKVHLDGALCRCGQRGCLEAYVADYALVREADTALNWLGKDVRSMRVRLESLFDHAKAGNAAARSIFKRAGRYLAVGLANVVNLFDPELVILSGERMRYDYLYADETLAELDRLVLQTRRSPPKIMVQTWGDHLWAYGAAALALSSLTDRLFTQPQEIAAE